MGRYQIWDKESNIYTPAGEELTPQEWIARYAWINIPTAIPVVAGGMFNGGFIGELGEMKTMYENMGAVFEEGLTNEEILDTIEAFENEMNTPSDTPQRGRTHCCRIGISKSISRINKGGESMTNFEMAKKNYERSLWTISMLEKLVEKGKLTEEEFNQIIEG